MGYTRTIRVSGNVLLSGHIHFTEDNAFDIGESAKEARNVYVDGTGYIDTLDPAPSAAAHDLGGAMHNADTLANLDGKVSDQSLGVQLILGRTFPETPINPAATEFLALVGSDTPDTTENRHKQTMPCAGTFKNLRVELLDSACGAGKSYTFTLRVNGADQALTCTISGGADVIGTDVVNTVTVAAGDEVNWEITPAGTPAANNCAISCEFVRS